MTILLPTPVLGPFGGNQLIVALNTAHAEARTSGACTLALSSAVMVSASRFCSGNAEIEIAERLPGGVLHDEARIVVLLNRPGRREAAHGSDDSAISALRRSAIAIGASIFGEHSPDPNKCDPDFRPFVTQTVSPTTITLGCSGPGSKHSPR